MRENKFKTEPELCQCDDCTARRPKRNFDGIDDPEKFKRIQDAVKSWNRSNKGKNIYYTPRYGGNDR